MILCGNSDQGGDERFEMRLPESAAEHPSTASLHHTGIKHEKFQKSNYKGMDSQLLAPSSRIE